MAENASKDSDEPTESVSVFRRRFRRFRSLKRGWYSFLILSTLYVISWGLCVLVNNRAVIVHYEGAYYFPGLSSKVYQGRQFGQNVFGEAEYRKLGDVFAAEEGSDNWVIMPPYPYSPYENLLDELPGRPPHLPTAAHILGTDDRGRDVFARLVYGFRVSLTFALLVLMISYAIGTVIGATLGFFGGRVDILGQRLVEIWASLPFLYTVMIVSSVIPQLALWELATILALFSWVGIAYYMRGEFYREKAKDYVSAAVAQGEARPSIMLKQILPNSLTPIISFAPFALVGGITAIVSLDFLGLGLPAPTASWGELLDQGLQTITTGKYHLILAPLVALNLTLLMVVFIGEAVREAFDPKVFSRLR